MLLKPCPGQFSDEVKLQLERNRDRAQWSSHTCLVCGKPMDAEFKAGQWVPTQHWPSVRYPQRSTDQSSKRHGRSRAGQDQTDALDVAESAVRN